jgi:hypothetical protein
MKPFKFLVLLIVFVLGMGAVNAQEADAAVAITLERTACFGTCPVYTVTILEDGTVLYNGGDFVEVTGEQSSEIDPETVALMVEAFANAGYFEWKETYDTQSVTDMAYVTTSVMRDGETHRIAHYLGDHSAPLALAFLENWIAEMANTQLWTGVAPDIAYISNGTDTPLITLQRTQCFGDCPIYNVALYEDGTVVYSGIANVNDIGVQVFEADADAIIWIAQKASMFGYFDWQDHYEEYIMTDQTTVLTSVRWEDQSKRIARYVGDPNAPIGLVEIEDDISQFVTDLTG